jgi:hypothetical protein
VSYDLFFVPNRYDGAFDPEPDGAEHGDLATAKNLYSSITLPMTVVHRAAHASRSCDYAGLNRHRNSRCPRRVSPPRNQTFLTRSRHWRQRSGEKTD